MRQCTESSVKNDRFCTPFSSPQKPGLIEGGYDGCIYPSKESKAKKLSWDDEIQTQKWTNFYTKIITKFKVTSLN